ncbi:MAG: DUF4160 domain-containing protein [Magnetococcales bacterium]|nr:DUF4160 domain-containing protein [Magnetococcales bacterium]
MPELARFYGILIAMYWRDHNPPHFHAFYGGKEAVLDLDGNLLEGGLPRRAQSMVSEWMSLHRSELMDNWERAVRREPLNPISPLE